MKSIFTSLFVLLCFSLFAQLGSLDPNFGINGVYKSNDHLTFYNNDGVKAVKVLPDGKILLAGFGNYNRGSQTHDFSALRLNANGTLDSSFGINGRASIGLEDSSVVGPTDDVLSAMSIQADGKIVLAGTISFYIVSTANNVTNYTDFGVARLNSNGTIDSTFNKTGHKRIDLSAYTKSNKSYDYCTGVAVRKNGQITLSGYTYNRTYPNGVFQEDYDVCLVQLNANGSFTKAFKDNGVQIFPKAGSDEIISGSALQNDGKLVLIGNTGMKNNTANNNILLERINANGEFDTTFNGTGYTINDIANKSIDFGIAVAILPNGKIVAGCIGSGNYLLEYSAKGKFVQTFGSKGRVFVDSTTSAGTISSLSIYNDGKIILTTQGFSVYRYLPNGSRDSSFGTNGKTSLADPRSVCYASAVQPDGKVIAAGTTDVILNRYSDVYVEVAIRLLGSGQTAANSNNDLAAIKPALSVNSFGVSLYPNPSHDHFGIRISGNDNFSEKITIKVVDLAGKVMEIISGVKAGELTQFGSKYPAGTYIINVSKGAYHKSVTVLKL